MAIQTMPGRGIVDPNFEPQRVDAMSPENGGAIGSVQIGWPRWVLKFNLTAMQESLSDEWRAFITRQRVPGRRFYSRDPSWRGPKSGLPVGDVVTDWSFAIDVDAEGDAAALLTLQTNLPGYIASVGDYIGFEWETGGKPRAAMVRLVASSVADATGSVTVEVEPALPTVVPETATAHMRNGRCIMRMSSETSIGDMSLSRYISANVVAVQELLP